MGNQREQVGELGAGNIPALMGLVEARAGNTLSTVSGIQMFVLTEENGRRIACDVKADVVRRAQKETEGVR